MNKNDFNVVADKLKINTKLNFLNKTKSTKLNFIDEYSDEMIKVINDLYHEDFENFGYRKMN